MGSVRTETISAVPSEAVLGSSSVPEVTAKSQGVVYTKVKSMNSELV